MARRETRSHRIVVTGATDGLGFLLARSYAARGHRVLATGRRNLPDHAAFFDEPNIRYIRADQSEPERAARSLAMALERLGWDSLDIAILNAATGWTGKPEEETAAQIVEQVDVNLTGPVQLAHALAPALLKGGGQLVLIGSTAAKGAERFATYAATKGALAGLARSLRAEWRGRASVSLIHPGPTRTGMHEKVGHNPGRASRLFMKPQGVSRAIERAVREREKEREITRFYAFRSRFGQPGEEQV